jgi:acyl carrier protein
MNESILEGVRRTAADVLRQPLDQVTASASRDSVPGWDSLAHVNLVLALEQQFDLQFLPEEMMEMLSVELIAMLIEEKLAAGRDGGRR